MADPINRMYVNIEGGKKISMPRYIKNKLYDEEQRIEIGFATYNRIRLQKLRSEALGITPSFRDHEQAVLAALRNQKNQITHDKI